jgi:4-hydroxybenzoyl-CoA thioesterase
MNRFITRKEVRIQHCDVAGFVFTPQYFNLYTEVVEDWWNYGLNISFRELMDVHQCAIPLRDFDGQFLSFSKLGDWLEFQLTVDGISNTSVTIRIEGYNERVMRCYVNMKLVHIDMVSKKIIKWPEKWQQKISSYKS